MNMHGGTALPIGFHRDRSHHHDVSRDTVGRLTFGGLPGHGGFRTALRQAEEVDVAALVQGHVLGDVDDPGRHCGGNKRGPSITISMAAPISSSSNL